MSQHVPDLPKPISFGGRAHHLGHPLVRRVIRDLEEQCQMFRDGWLAAERRNEGIGK
ncbi:hypothetical protein [Nocardia sp. NPDC004711]